MTPPPTSGELPTPWDRTPLIYSESISSRYPGFEVYLKLEVRCCVRWASVHAGLNDMRMLRLQTFQPSQCFKQRTQGALAQEVIQNKGGDASSVHFVVASSGNAALSLAQVSSTLGSKCTVFIVEDAATSYVLNTLKRYGANAIVFGKTYPAALEKAKTFVENTPNA